MFITAFCIKGGGTANDRLAPVVIPSNAQTVALNPEGFLRSQRKDHMNSIDNIAYEGETLRQMTEMYHYCKERGIPMICNALISRTVQADGSFDNHDWQLVNGEFEDMNPAMQAFYIVAQLPPDVQLMAVQMLIKVDETAEMREAQQSAKLN
jgi:hypothetical protein